MTYQACDCVPQATKEEAAKMYRWFAGEEVEGFPKHDKRILYGYTDDRYIAPPVDRIALDKILRGE